MAQMLSVVLSSRRRYSIAHVDVFSGWAFAWASVACALLHALGKPYGLTLHGGELPVFSRRFPRAVSRLLARAAFVTAPSSFLQNAFRTARADIRLVPNALDIAAYPYRHRARLEARLVWMRAFHHTYGPLTVPDVIADMVRRRPSVVAAMFGPDKGDGSLEMTRRRIDALGISDRLSIGGAIAKSAVPSVLAQADIFLNTSRVDNAPVVLSEAMACGLCVVSTAAGGIPDLVADGETAVLVSAETHAFVEAIERVLRDQALASRLSAAARRRAESMDWGEVLPVWERLLLGAGGGRPPRER